MSDEKFHSQTLNSHQNYLDRLLKAVVENDVKSLKEILKKSRDDDYTKSIFKIEYYFIFFQKLILGQKKVKKIVSECLCHLNT